MDHLETLGFLLVRDYKIESDFEILIFPFYITCIYKYSDKFISANMNYPVAFHVVWSYRLLRVLYVHIHLFICWLISLVRFIECLLCAGHSYRYPTTETNVILILKKCII